MRDLNPLRGVAHNEQYRWQAAPEPIKPRPVGEELQQGVNGPWMRMAQIRAQVRDRYGRMNAPQSLIDREVRRRYLSQDF